LFHHGDLFTHLHRVVVQRLSCYLPLKLGVLEIQRHSGELFRRHKKGHRVQIDQSTSAASPDVPSVSDGEFLKRIATTSVASSPFGS
jgi:hypothetical protein